jgi:biotin carboxyl carrier protein
MSAYTVTRNGATYTVLLKRRRAGVLTFSIDDREYSVPCESTSRVPPAGVSVAPLARERVAVGAARRSATATPEITAPLPGIISDIKVCEGDRIEPGSTLVVIEAMKMENPIKASAAAVVKTVHIKKGQEVGHGALLLSLELA